MEALRGQWIHFIGIAGRAMGGVALALKAAGCKITGSDWACYPPMSDKLARAGIEVNEDYYESQVRAEMDVVVVGSQIKRGHVEVEEAMRLELELWSLPEFLAKKILPGKRCLMVAGTNGKSTTTSMAAWILKVAGYDPGYLIGGLSEHFPESFHLGTSEFFVLEGDEFGSSMLGDLNPKFLHYRPEAVALLNVSADHPDYFRRPEDVYHAFRALMARVPPQGLVVVNVDDDRAWEVSTAYCGGMLGVGIGKRAVFRLREIVETETGSFFTFRGHEFFISMAGEMNRTNAVLATMLALHAGVSMEVCVAALKQFRGVHERQQLLLEENGFTHVQDMVYHPQGLRLMLEAMRRRYEGRRVVLVFQPRSTGPRHWPAQRELPLSLAKADAVLLLPAMQSDYLDKGQPFSVGRVARETRALGVEVELSKKEEIAKKKFQRLLRGGDVVVSCIRPSRRRELSENINQWLRDFTAA